MNNKRFISIRAGTQSQIEKYLGYLSELTYNKTTRQLVAHDGETTGGIPLLSTKDIDMELLDAIQPEKVQKLIEDVDSVQTDFENFLSDLTSIQLGFLQTLTDTVYVRSLSDLPDPDPITGGIELEEDLTYRFVGTVNIGTNYLIVKNNTHLTGDNWGRDAILYTGEDYAIVCDHVKLNMKFVSIIAPHGGAINFDSTGEKITIFLCGFFSSKGIIVKNSNVSSFKFCIFNSACCSHLNFCDGRINKMLIDACIFDSGEIGIEIKDIEIDTIDISGNYFTLSESSVGIKVENTTLNNEGIIRGNSFEGNFTYVEGIDSSTVGYDFKGNTGIEDSTVSGGFLGNIESTITITNQNEWVKIENSFVSRALRRMLYDNGTLTYIGLKEYQGRIIVSISGESLSNNQRFEFAIFKNEVITDIKMPMEYRFSEISQSTSINDFLVLNENDAIDVWVRNTKGTANFKLETISLTFN